MKLRIVSALGTVLSLSVPVAGCYVEPAQPAPPPPQVVAPAAPSPQAEVLVEEPPPPPPPQVEPAPPPPPTPEHIWVTGSYRWNGGRYEWERGHYERPPRPSARYVAGHWRATARGHVWIGGRWD